MFPRAFGVKLEGDFPLAAREFTGTCPASQAVEMVSLRLAVLQGDVIRATLAGGRHFGEGAGQGDGIGEGGCRALDELPPDSCFNGDAAHVFGFCLLELRERDQTT
jgi:hypothetical protein